MSGQRLTQAYIKDFNKAKKTVGSIRQFVGMPIKFIMVLRNPFDTVATQVLRTLKAKARKKSGKSRDGTITEVDQVINTRMKQFVHSYSNIKNEINFVMLIFYLALIG